MLGVLAMTETLQDKIDAIYYQSDDDGETGFGIQTKEHINKAIQELREEIISLLPNGRFSELPLSEQSRTTAYLKVLALIGEKK